jgi:hypothetical protein
MSVHTFKQRDAFAELNDAHQHACRIAERERFKIQHQTVDAEVPRPMFLLGAVLWLAILLIGCVLTAVKWGWL